MQENRNPDRAAPDQIAPPLDQRRELNNVLAQLARQGNSAALAQLWEINRPVLRRMFWQWYGRNRSIADAAGLTLEDFEQEGFFAVKQAAEYHDPEKGAFLTSLHYFVLRQIREATYKGGGRYVITEDGRKVRVSAEPLNGAQSLDEPVPWDDDGEVTRADVTPDPAAAQAFEDAERASYIQELRAVLGKALALLPDRQREAITRRFYEGLTLRQTAELDGVTPERIRQLEALALRAMRKNQELRRFYGEDLLARAYQGISFNSWKIGGSVQERLVERQEERERRLAASSTKHLAELLGMDTNELGSLLGDARQ
ncbi:sigma-70 family RNA polymerase sigma factor [Gemmiger formicilis]|uniref:sigma-70 family RNA polymerase sigma factor n=1 Tax=Gemmiger formicilis TaxID=745368 RepID=UPI00195C7E32|nr:sigma-70 family RNA polymerase sigma factor [Gemmiger formicilis]MBM6914029.1 sigma-70 family RNA polymerase sigma factor [Gemmiger formicilis]